MKTNSIKIAIFFAVFAGAAAMLLTSCAAAKPNNEGSSSQKIKVANVAVIETEMDIQSGVNKELTKAEVREITAELRRQAVKNLPKSKYNVMTEATVQAQGAAVLEECFQENCLITLGSKIGADYIVRGTISKFQKRFTLSVEIYDTEDGNLIVSSDPVRSESIDKLLDASASACADMYKTFIETYIAPENSKSEKKEEKATKKNDNNQKLYSDEEKEQTSFWCRTFLLAKDKESFTVGERCKTYWLNIIPGLGSITVMNDWLGAAIQWALSGGGVALMYQEIQEAHKAQETASFGTQYKPGAKYYLSVALIGSDYLFSAYRSINYVNPKFETAFGKNEGFNFAVLPNRHGELMPYIGYNIKF
jgi:TolB-like protein